MRRTLVVIVTALLALLGAAPRPSAAAAGAWPGEGICTQVEGIGGTVQRQSSTRDSYRISGYVSACPGADDPQARWTVVRYGTGTPAVAAGPVPYLGPGERYHFLYKRDASSGAWAVCVVNHMRPTEADPLLSTASRVACFGPDPAGPTTPTGPVPTGPDGPMLQTPLVPVSVDDPRFEGVLVVGESFRSTPACAGCV